MISVVPPEQAVVNTANATAAAIRFAVVRRAGREAVASARDRAGEMRDKSALRKFIGPFEHARHRRFCVRTHESHVTFVTR